MTISNVVIYSCYVTHVDEKRFYRSSFYCVCKRTEGEELPALGGARSGASPGPVKATKLAPPGACGGAPVVEGGREIVDEDFVVSGVCLAYHKKTRSWEKSTLTYRTR